MMTESNDGNGGNGATRFPLDLESLRKGDTITSETIRDIIKQPGETDGPDPESKTYQVRVLALQQWLQAALKPWTVRQLSGSIRILTDEEALDWNDRLFDKAKEKMVRRHVLVQGVEHTNLTERQKKRHRKVLRDQQFQLHKLLEAEGTCQIRESKRMTRGQPIPFFAPPELFTLADEDGGNGGALPPPSNDADNDETG
jgi:hypothetical protein